MSLPEQPGQEQNSVTDNSGDSSHSRRKGYRRAIIAIVAIVLLGLGAWALQSTLTSGEMQGQDAAAGVAIPRSETDGARAVRRESRQPAARTESEAADEGSDAVSRPATNQPLTQPSTVTDTPVQSDAINRSGLTDGPGLIAIAGLEGVDLWDHPDGARFLTLPTSTRLTASGRSADGNWIFVTGDDAVGWTPATQLIAFDLISLPVVTAAETPVMPPAVGYGPVEQLDRMEVVAVENPVSAEPMATAADALAQTAVSMLADSTATSTAINIQDVMATVTLNDSRLNVRSGPGTGYSIIAKTYPGESYGALGRDNTGAWVQIDLPGVEGGFGWVSSEYLHLSEPALTLAVSDRSSTAPEIAQVPLQRSSAISVKLPATTQATSSTAEGSGLNGILVFQDSNGGTIYAYDLETGELRPLTYGFDPAISPNGGAVAFTRDGGENGLYLIDIDGGNERLIFSGRAGLRSPTWSPDGNWVAFSRADEFTECRRAGRGGCVSDDELAELGLLPDNFPLIREYHHKVARVDYDGNNYRDLVTLDSAQAPNWNEAGIVYESEAGLQITDDVPDAVNRLVIFDYLKPYYQDPDWQPNGGRIVYQGREASHMEIFAINPDGSGQVALTKPVTTLVDVLPSNVSPAWSPNGEHIIFLSNRGEDNSAGAWQLWVMDADGSNQHLLPMDVSFEYSFGGEQMVSWGE